LLASSSSYPAVTYFSAYGLTDLGTGLGWICLLELLKLRDCSNELGIILWLCQKERRSGEYTIFQQHS
jgi:hypothetical protein